MTKEDAYKLIDEKIKAIDEAISLATEAIEKLRESKIIWKQKKKALENLRHEVTMDCL